MKPKYHIWIFVGLVLVIITTISFWGYWAYIVYITVAVISFDIFVICYPVLWLIFWRKPEKENKVNQTEKYPRKMKYLDWEYVNGKPVAKAIEEKEVTESQ